jgi:hypothetical protein
VATDTALAMDSSQRSAGHPTSVLITAQVFRMKLSPCMDTIVIIRNQQNLDGQVESCSKKWKFPSFGQDDNHDQDSDDMTVHSIWKAEIQPTLYVSPETMECRPTILEYAVVESHVDGGLEVRWKTAFNAD